MGYDVYITRSRHLLEGPQVPIPVGDWHTLIDNDPQLTAPEKACPGLARWTGPSSLESPWMDWANGNIFSTDPDHSVIRKLVEIAGFLGGHVQGQDGEFYSIERGQVRRTAAPEGARDDRNASFALPPDEALERERVVARDAPFVVGQRVRTPWGRPATVVDIDPDADWGMGHIEIQYDDGRTATTSCMTHGLEPL